MTFENYIINDVIEEIIDYRGKTPKKLGGDWSPIPTKFKALSAKNIKGGRIVQQDTIRYVDDEMYSKWMKQEVNKGTILITSEAPFGELLYWDSDEKIVLSQRLFGLKIKKEFNPRYVYYYMFSKKFQAELSGRATGSTVTGLRQPELLKCNINIPEKEIQDKIANILKSIDRKIDLNNKINNNLHELINSLYKELFNTLDDNNSSLIQLKEISKSILGGTPSRANPEYWNGNINWINSGEINKFRILTASEKITEEGLNKSSATMLPKKTTVIAITGATLGQVSRLEIESCANQSVIGIVPFDEKLNNYIYLYILNNIKDLISSQTGGAQQHINKNNVETFKIRIPKEEQIKMFNNKVNSVFEKIRLNCLININLEQLRNTLLPKLMNGEIELDNIEI